MASPYPTCFTRRTRFMARSRPDLFSTIEYIGPRPQRPKRPNIFGGWVIGLIAMAIAFWFGRPLLPFLKATQESVSTEQAALLISSLAGSGRPGDTLAAAALAHSREPVTFDGAYYQISYPGGDIPPGKGNAADVIVRAYRRTGIDLQKEVHEDMKSDFRLYPQLWGALGPDPNIDHRRVANLRRFFERKGTTIEASRDPQDYQPGDIVVWSLADAEPHIGIVVPGPGRRAAERWVVHHKDGDLRWEDVLFDFRIEARFRYPADVQRPASGPGNPLPPAGM